jgi:hypothetical protein
MTIIGKGTIINAFDISNTTYIPPSDKHLKIIQQHINNFFCRVRPINYSNKQIYRPITEGGFNVPDLNTKCMAQYGMWIQYYNKAQRDNLWTGLFKQLAGRNLARFGVEHYNNVNPIIVNNNSIYSFFAKYKGKVPVNWINDTSRDIYRKMAKTVTQKFTIENVLKTMDWTEIWTSWKNRPHLNKYKLTMHTIISNQYNTKKRYNKSNNCPMCDFPFVQSRDHTFINCQGAIELIDYIQNTFAYEIDAGIFFEKCMNNNQYTVILAYVQTIVKLTEGWHGKWGKPPLALKIQKVHHYVDKIKSVLG